MAAHVVVLDANVLYGIEVTDLVLTMATRHLYRPHWSPQILDEYPQPQTWADLDPVAIDRRIAQMNQALPSALDEPPASLIEEMPVNEKDRHVLALAVHVEAPMIVTENLRDFPPELLADRGIEAIDVDTFVVGHVERDPIGVLGAIDAMAARRRRHPKTSHDIIEVLAASLPHAMAALRE